MEFEMQKKLGQAQLFGDFIRLFTSFFRQFD